MVYLLLWKKITLNMFLFNFSKSISRQKCVLVVLWCVIWSQVQTVYGTEVKHRNHPTSKENSLSDLYSYTAQNKLFSSWMWSTKQAWNVILFYNEFQTFHKGNTREKLLLSSLKSLADYCWHLFFQWCSEIPGIRGLVQNKLINQT